MGFAEVLRIPVFGLLFLAEAQSLIGDQLARVALSVLVYDATGSAPATAATYAATLLPAIFGGVVVSRLGDRFPRRTVMVGCEVFRAGCFAAMTIPGVPLGILIALVVVAVAAGPVFSAAEVSYLAAELDAEQFRAGNGLRMIASQATAVGGFVFGGVLVTAIGPRATLAVDAATFALSAVLVTIACRRPRVDGPAAPTATPTAMGAGRHRPWRDPYLRNLVLLTLLVGFFVVPEGLAVPFGDSVSAATWQVGVLLASGALGGALGAVFLVSRVRPAVRPRVSRWLAVACGVPLLLTPLTDRWPLVAAAWFASGFCAAYVVETTSASVRAVPDGSRSSFVGTVSALMLSAQGLGLIGFGLVAQWTDPGTAVAVAGACGTVLAIGVARAAAYTERRVDLSARRVPVAGGARRL